MLRFRRATCRWRRSLFQWSIVLQCSYNLLTITFLVVVFYLGVVPTCSVRSTSALSALISEDEMSADQLEIKKIADKWGEVRLMDKDATGSLEPEWQEAYNRFYEKYDKDMEYMTEVTEKLQKMIEPPKVEKKSKGQKKRDAWAKVQAREAARAARK